MLTVNYFNKTRLKVLEIPFDRNKNIEGILTGKINIHTLCKEIVDKTGSKLCSILTYPTNSKTDHFNIIHSTDPRISFCKDMPILNIPFEQKICIISNKVSNDPRNINFNSKKCPIKKVCGIPIIKDGSVYGQIILANRPKGYSGKTIKNIISEIELISNIIISQDENYIFHNSKKTNDLKFLSSIAHELHTPIHGIVSMTSLLQEVGELNNKQNEYISCILSSCEDLIEIVRDSIDFQKIKLGNLGIINDTFDLRKMIADIINLLRFKADRKKLYLEYTIDKNISPTVYGDKNRLSQIMLNLIGNAIKFTSTGGIKISIKQYPSRVIFIIKDTGCGIKKENLDRIFDEYYQEDEVRKGSEGMGLGLSLSKKLIQMMGGGITVESTYEKGTTFTIDIPLAEERYKTESLMYDEPMKILIIDENEKNRVQLLTYLYQWKVQVDVVASFKEGRKLVEYNADCYSIFMINTSNLVESFAFAKWINEVYINPKIISIGTFSGNNNIFDSVISDVSNKNDVYNTLLQVKNMQIKKSYKSESNLSFSKICIVEDDDISSFALKEILISIGIDKNNISIIDNGEQAVRNITHTRYDIVFMDCRLGKEMTGIKATKILKQSMTDLVIIGITASVTDEEKLDWLNSGLDGYLTKPFTKNMIENVMQKYF